MQFPLPGVPAVPRSLAARAPRPPEVLPLKGRRHFHLGLWAALLACTALAVWIFIRWKSSGGFSLRDFLGTITHADWRWLALSICITFAGYLGRAFRWAVFLEPLAHSPSVPRILTATVIGFTAIQLLGRPGELVRPYLISLGEKVSFSSQLAAWFLERVYDSLLVLAIFGIALVLYTGDTRFASAGLNWVLRTGGSIAAAIGAACLAILFALHRLSPAVLRQRLSPLTGLLPASYAGKASHLLGSLIDGFASIRNVSSALRVLGWSIVQWGIISAAFLAAFRAFPETRALAPTDVIVFMGFVAFGGIIQIPGIGGGMQVVAALVLVELFRLSIESATGIALAIWATGFVSVVPLGLILALSQGLQWGKLRHLKESIEL